MSFAPTECLRCKGRMEQGIVYDKPYGSSVLSEQQWADGTPEHSFWTGLKIQGHERFKVMTYRCERCGFLESYATEHVS